ncbi:uncharacterized protein PRCAT00002938001 [Priceomyces carsonii]|uniref:uncharacterized protein n=1 Tax=Priceomyces carsonii TaxID=28549 RepID=UPI002ED88DB0|nr:unnamed protein product [Priceomyces carsonii]
MIQGIAIHMRQARSLVSKIYSDRPYQPLISEGYKGILKIVIPKNVDLTNQVINTERESDLKRIVDCFDAPIYFAYGYGSGVFEQAGYQNKRLARPQIDLIHIVEDPQKFHEANLRQFLDHYSFLKFLSAGSIAEIQNLGVGLYFNPFAVIDNSLIKYGVISVDKTLLDLSEWSSLYLAGRLQKPVKYLVDKETTTHPMIKFLNQFNLKNAMTLAILLLKKDHFNEIELYEAIANISYVGDFRNLIGGENPNKVKNIVNKQYDNFKILYEPILAYFIDKGFIEVMRDEDGIKKFRKILNAESKSFLISKMPIQFRRNLYQLYKDKSIREIARDNNLNINLNRVVKKIVRVPSLVQLLKGILTAGPVKSFRYALEKNMKFRTAQ